MLRPCRVGRSFRLLLALLLIAAEAAAAPGYEIQGIKGELLENARAWLGDAPESATARADFLATAGKQVADSLRALGYYHADVRLGGKAGARGNGTILIHVDPGRPVTIAAMDIELRGAAAEDPAFADLLGKSPLKKGDVLHHGRYNQLKKSLLTLGQKRGYFDAEIAHSEVKVDMAANSAMAKLVYASGERYRYGEIRHDEELLVRRRLEQLMPFDQDDLFLMSELQQLQSALQETGYFKVVTVRPLVDEAENSRVPVQIGLAPESSHKIDLGVGYSTDTRERFSITWQSPRLNRGGHSQQTRLEYSRINPALRFNYHVPLTHPLNDSLLLSARIENNEFGDLESQQQGVSAMREHGGGGWRYGYGIGVLRESWDIGREQRRSEFIMPQLTLSHRYLKGKLVDPSDGFSQIYRLQFGAESLGSEIDMVRATANFTWVWTPAYPHRLVASSELGAVLLEGGDRRQLPPSLGFFAGGSKSLRGFDYNQLGVAVLAINDAGEQVPVTAGGDRLATGSLEYQRYFTPNWRGALFFDYGDAFNENSFNANYGAGFGVHYITPVGALKIELANSLSEDDPSWQLHLNVGAEF